MENADFRRAIEEYIREHARPVDKFSHQPRLYRLARQLAASEPFDDDVLFAAAWLHDLGVFVGHRPEDPAALVSWDHIAYATRKVPELLREFGFPSAKIPAVVAAIQAHLPSGTPSSFEGVLLRDADILEQLGAVGILRTVSKVGRDTRFVVHGDAIRVLRQNAQRLPGQLRLATARRLAEARLETLVSFLDAIDAETRGTELQ